MPLPGIFSSVTAHNTRFKMPVLSGTIDDGGATAGPLPSPGAFICVQSTAALVSQILTSTGQPAKSSFVYITQGSLAMTSSTNANIAADPPYTGSGAAMYYDFTRKKLSIWSTGNGTGEWFSVSLSSS